jgi:hypothetical protein
VSKLEYETIPSRAWLSLPAGLFTWAVAASVAQLLLFNVEDWGDALWAVPSTVLQFQLASFILTLIVGLVLWTVFLRATGRLWQAMLIGALCYFFAPLLFAAVVLWATYGLVLDPAMFASGLVSMASTLAVGAIVGGVMWRVAYRRVVTPPAADVFA